MRTRIHPDCWRRLASLPEIQYLSCFNKPRRGIVMLGKQAGGEILSALRGLFFAQRLVTVSMVEVALMPILRSRRSSSSVETETYQRK